MRVAVTGKQGQVVASLIECGRSSGHKVVAVGRPVLDLTKPESVKRALQAAVPDVIVSAAAYTAVDDAENNIALAHEINANGAKEVALAAKALEVPLIHISTDYVFDGKLDRPYVETDPTGPTSVYGASKLAGEREILNIYPEGAAILRVAWVFSPFGGNFVKTMLRLAGDRTEISVVSDQFGNPTSALDIANGVLKVATNLTSSQNKDLRGVFHMTAKGEVHWADFAKKIFAISAANGGPSAKVNPIASSDYPTSASRPANSRLNCNLLAQRHGVILPDWQGSLEAVISRLQAT